MLGKIACYTSSLKCIVAYLLCFGISGEQWEATDPAKREGCHYRYDAPARWTLGLLFWFMCHYYHPYPLCLWRGCNGSYLWNHRDHIFTSFLLNSLWYNVSGNHLWWSVALRDTLSNSSYCWFRVKSLPHWSWLPCFMHLPFHFYSPPSS